MNVDLFADLLYLSCAIALLTVAFARVNDRAVRGVSAVVGVLLLAVGIAGLVDE